MAAPPKRRPTSTMLHCAVSQKAVIALMMEAVRTTEKSVYFTEITRRYVPESYHRPDDGGSTSLLNVGLLHRDYTALCPRKLSSP
jgi:hypothetical protein